MIQGLAGIAGLLLLAWIFSEKRGAVPWRAGLLATAVRWVLAFAIFLVRYVPVVTRPRADGKAG